MGDGEGWDWRYLAQLGSTCFGKRNGRWRFSMPAALGFRASSMLREQGWLWAAQHTQPTGTSGRCPAQGSSSRSRRPISSLKGWCCGQQGLSTGVRVRWRSSSRQEFTGPSWHVSLCALHLNSPVLLWHQGQRCSTNSPVQWVL